MTSITESFPSALSGRNTDSIRKENDILDRVLKGARLTSEEALFLYNEGDFLKIQYAAREMRAGKVDPATASYTMFRIINYTNYCTIQCKFCSFKADMGADYYVLSRDEILEKMDQAVAVGARQMFLQGGVHPDLKLDYYLDLLRAVKERFGDSLHIRAFSPVEILHLSRNTGLSLPELLARLKEAGLDSVPGAGAEILTERMRKILSPDKTTVEEWIHVMETCHREGLPGTANIVFGSEETREEVIEHLKIVRDIQDRTGGFQAFIPWTFQQQTKAFHVRKVPPHEYLKVLGVSRLFLDNIDHVEVSVMVLGPELGALSLHSGADDISSIVIEENVLRNRSFTSEDKARTFLTDSGFHPRKRDFLYRYEE